MIFEKNILSENLSIIIPYSISRFLISYFFLISEFKKHRIKTIITCVLIFILAIKYNFCLNPKGFQYQGFILNVLSICMFIIFSIISNKIY